MTRETAGDKPILRSKLFRVGVLYSAEDFPLGVFYQIVPVHFRMQAIGLSEEFEL